MRSPEHENGWPSSAALATLALVCALCIGLTGISGLVPDEHEVLVVQTAREMLARDDWVVPYYNGEPRLKKPPANYWLTIILAEVTGATVIEPWHGRLVSLLAGFVTTGLIYVFGRGSYGSTSAARAALLYASSAGYFTYVHDARPDFLYAAACFTALWCAWLVTTRGPRGFVWGMWAAFGSAILIKGPQIPLLLLLAIVYYAWRHCGGWSAVRAFYPARGLMLVAAIALPWFLVLRLRLGGDTLGGSQLSGALLLPSVAHVLNGYYLYRPLQLVLPWLPLVLAAGWALLTIRPQPDGLTRFLLISIVFVLGGLSLGSQQRYFYALPVWPAAALVLGRGLEILRASRPRWFSIVCNLQALIIAAAAAWMCSQVAAWAALVVVAFLLGTSVRVQSLRVPLMCLAVVVLFVRFADSPMLWSADRFARAGFAETVSRIVPPQAPLVAYKLTPAIYIQASGRSIPALRDLAQLRQWRDGDTGSVRYVLTLPKFRREILTAFQVRTLVAMPRSVGDAAVLYQVELSSN